MKGRRADRSSPGETNKQERWAERRNRHLVYFQNPTIISCTLPIVFKGKSEDSW
jgi:hypothetical protein